MRGYGKDPFLSLILEAEQHIVVMIEAFMWDTHVHNIYVCVNESESEKEVAPPCPTLCDPIDCSLPGSSVHGIFQAIVLEWIAISISRGSSQPRA